VPDLSHTWDEDSPHRTVLEAIPHMLMVVDEDIRILYANPAAAQAIRAHPPTSIRNRFGEVMHCLNALGGCGRSKACKSCDVRGSVRDAIAGRHVKRTRTRLTIVREGETVEAHVLISASPLGDRFPGEVLVMLEDITSLVRLERLVPVCAYCGKVRNEQQVWQPVGEFLGFQFDARVTHGICEECEARFFGDEAMNGTITIRRG
jgi:nitrogen-specific signal transduction histidine kinase